MGSVVEIVLLVAVVLGALAALFAVLQGIEWSLQKFRRIKRRLGGKARVVRRDDMSTLESNDASRFVRDVEFVDGTVVAPGERFRKIWEIQNTGGITWERRYLERVGALKGPGLIKSTKRVPIPTTRPGEVVQLTVELEAPKTEGTSTAGFKMTDQEGNLCFADRYPEGIFVTANVVQQTEGLRPTAAKEDTEALPAVSVAGRVEGTWALLDIENAGGKAARFRATARIIEGTGQNEEPYSVRWRETYECDVLINAGDAQVLNLGEALPGSFETGDVLRYRGFRFNTAQLPTGEGQFSEGFERRQVSDGGIVIEVSITSEPRLREPFKERYLLREAKEPGWQTLNISEGKIVNSTPPNPKIEFRRIEPGEWE